MLLPVDGKDSDIELLLKQQWPDAQKFVADPEQDGFGIGVVEWRP